MGPQDLLFSLECLEGNRLPRYAPSTGWPELGCWLDRRGAPLGVVLPASCLCGLSGAWSLWPGHACCLPTVKPNAALSQHSGPRPGDRQECLESVWLQLPRCWAPTLARPFPDSPVPLWLERAPSCSHCFFQEFTACLGFRKHLHKSSTWLQRERFPSAPLAGQVPPPRLAFSGVVLGSGVRAGVCSQGMRIAYPEKLRALWSYFWNSA